MRVKNEAGPLADRYDIEDGKRLPDLVVPVTNPYHVGNGSIIDNRTVVLPFRILKGCLTRIYD